MSVTLRVENGIGIIDFNNPDARVNVLNFATLTAFDKLLDQAAANSSLQALIIQSSKKDIFIAGADIKEIEGITDPNEGAQKAKAGQDVFNKLEDLKIPTVAVIDGACLGGGCELALACKYRVATFNDKVRIGLPEVNLGILPGFGGTYRMPKLVGLSQALTLILAGKVISGQDALKIGLVDRLLPQTGLDRCVREFVNVIQGSPQRLPVFKRKTKGLIGFLDNNSFGQTSICEKAKENTYKMTKGFYPAPLQALFVIRKNLHAPRQMALNLEAQEFGKLVGTDVCKSLIKVFYLSEKYKKLSAPGAEGLAVKEIKKCGVLGAGIMGGGIAQLLANYDVAVRLKDLNYDAVAKGFQAAAKIFKQAVEKRKLKSHQLDVKMAKISGTTDYSGFKTADCIIEAVVENLDVKKKVFKEVSGVLSPGTLLFTNTSALSVTEMAKACPDPAKVIGFHFFNPVHRMPLVEIITTPLTAVETTAAALNFAKKLGKTPILVKDAPGFLVNRILLAYINEAGYLLEQGVPMTMIDKIMTDFGMPMGPITLADEVGLDVGLKVLHILHEGLGDRFKPAGIFEKVVGKGLLGKKSGKGFYLHGAKRIPNPEVLKLFPPRTVSGSQFKDFEQDMIFSMVNEAARCLADGIVDGPDTVDIGMIMGTGFPPFRGGLLHYADAVGVTRIVEHLQGTPIRLKSDRLAPAEFLLSLKNIQGKFYSKSKI